MANENIEIAAAYKRGYSKGYGSGAKWPEHKPPLPPESAVRAMMKPVLELRDKVDADYGALFDQDDPFNAAINPYITAVDDALSLVSKWLKDQPT